MSNEFLVVAIGASAGGLQALEEFFSTIATDSRGSGAAYCVVQHLSPDFKSLMPKILGRHTNLTIEVAEDGMPIAAGHLYLNRADHHIVIEEGVFRFRPKERGVRFPIDLFLTSAAATFGDRVVATLLSGSGSDGSRGIAAVKAAGGQILVQDPESADFDGMPNASPSKNVAPAQAMPTTSPRRLNSGPPLLPGLIAASVWIRPVMGRPVAEGRSRSSETSQSESLHISTAMSLMSAP